MMPGILVAGVGNVFLGDDGFGVEVVRRLAERSLGDGVRVADFGTRGLDLVYALLDGYEQVILVDAVRRGGQPGTICLLDVGPADIAQVVPALDAHAVVPTQVLALASSMGARLPSVQVVGCEPAALPIEDIHVGLSDPVQRAVEAAVELIESMVTSRLQAGGVA